MGKYSVNVVYKIPNGVLCSQLMAFSIVRYVAVRCDKIQSGRMTQCKGRSYTTFQNLFIIL